MKKIPGDIITLHMCTKNNDHMMYGSWNIICDEWTDGWIDTKKWHKEVGVQLKNLTDWLNANIILLNVKKNWTSNFQAQEKKTGMPNKNQA